MKNSFPTLGVIGGGELARMFVAPAAALGVDLLIYASDPNDSAAQICNHEIGSYKDLDAIRKFAKKCDDDDSLYSLKLSKNIFDALYSSYGNSNLTDIFGSFKVVNIFVFIFWIFGFSFVYGKHLSSVGNIFDCANLQTYKIKPPLPK